MPTTVDPRHSSDLTRAPAATATFEATLAVLVIEPWRARLLLSDDWSTVEVLDRFPVVATTELRRRFGHRRKDQEAARSGFDWRVFSAVRASVPADLPIVLAGDPTAVGSFRRHADEHGLNVVGVVEGVEGRASPTLLRSLARGVVSPAAGRS